MEFCNIELPKNIILPTSDTLETLQAALCENFHNIIKEYTRKSDKAKEHMESAEAFLLAKVDTNPVSIEKSLSKATNLFFLIGKFRVDAISFQTIFEVIHFCPKKHKVSETDRKQHVAIKTLFQTNLCGHLKNIEDKLEKQINALQSILKAETTRLGKINHL